MGDRNFFIDEHVPKLTQKCDEMRQEPIFSRIES